MMDKNDNMEATSGDPSDVLLQQLFHLKGYEIPETARMTRNKQNIMRQVREVSGRKRWSLSDLLEVNIPWFFAEPRYGIAALFVVFATLQFWGISTNKQAGGKTGIYSQDGGIAMAGQNTNSNSDCPWIYLVWRFGDDSFPACSNSIFCWGLFRTHPDCPNAGVSARKRATGCQFVRDGNLWCFGSARHGRRRPTYCRLWHECLLHRGCNYVRTVDLLSGPAQTTVS